MDSVPKGRKIILNYALKEFFNKIKFMVYDESLLNYPDWKITLTEHTDPLIKSWVLLSVRIINQLIFLNNIKQYKIKLH